MAMSIPEATQPPGLAEAAKRLDAASALEILRWAIDECYPHIAVACSMQDAVVIDLATKIEPRIEVFFLQTLFHFPETLETASQIKKRYSLNLVELQPQDNAAVYTKDGYDACCADRKVAPLEKYLSTKKAWVTGIRRADSQSRGQVQPVEWDAARGLIKVNPIASWNDEDVARYIDDNDVIVNPLRSMGFASIGCAPCTARGDAREGRWAGTSKTECGIHVYREPALSRPEFRISAEKGSRS